MRSQFKTMNKKDSFCAEATFVKNQIKFAWIIIQSIHSYIFKKRISYEGKNLKTKIIQCYFDNFQ